MWDVVRIVLYTQAHDIKQIIILTPLSLAKTLRLQGSLGKNWRLPDVHIVVAKSGSNCKRDSEVKWLWNTEKKHNEVIQFLRRWTEPWMFYMYLNLKHSRYHGRWFLTKNGKKLFFAVQVEKTEINILPKKWEKFQDRREKLFLNLINPWRYIDKFLSSPIKIHRQLSCVMWIAVWFQLNERDVGATNANCSWLVVFSAS